MTTPARAPSTPSSETEVQPSTDHLWRQFHESLLTFLRARVADPSQADDLLMEVFLRIEKGLPSVKDTSAIPGWIFRIARNLVIDHYREQRREVALPEQSLPNEAPEDLDNEAEREMARCVLAMLNHLPEATGTLLRWVDLEGMSQRAAAEKMELSPSGARSKVQRGRAQLKNMITECCSVERDRLGNILSHRCKDDRCC